MFSVIIVSYNNLHYLKRCLSSIYEQAYEPLEIIIVDNNSDEETLRYLKTLSTIRLIVNKVNLGFAKANNMGFSIASGDWIILLNNDTNLHGDYFIKLSRFINKNPEADVIGPLVLSEDGFPQVTFHYNSYVKNLLLPSESLRQFHQTLSFGGDTSKKREVLLKNCRRFSFVSTHDVDGLSGVCMIIRKKLIDRIGLFDEKYFLYVEDMDFCVKAKRAGAKIVFTPEISLTHFLKPLEDKNSPVSWQSVNNNLKYFFKKNFPWHVNIFAQCILTCKSIFKVKITRGDTEKVL